MAEAFGTVLIIVCVIAIVVAILSFWDTGSIYRGLGRSGPFSLEEVSDRRAPAPQSPAALAEAREEIRQMLTAKSDRRERRGEPPLDIEAELEALLAPQATSQDPELREEIRQHVIARNDRLRRQGKEPLDVEAEIERHLRESGA
jgi:hypothetical protein